MNGFAFFALMLAPGAWCRPASAVEARGNLEAVEIAGQIQIKYSDRKGSHVLTIDSRGYFPDDLPADAEITVIGAEATFRLGGAFLRAIPGTIFSAGESKGQEYLFLRQGELSVKLRGETTVLDHRTPHFSFRRTRRADAGGGGWLK